MKTAIIETLRSFTKRESIDLAMTAEPPPEAVAYPPIAKYRLDLSHHTKPETASENLFRELAKDVLSVNVFSQVKAGDGFVDFVLPEDNGSAVVLELKPLFQCHSDIELRRYALKPQNHIHQVQRYLREHEYVILTDLREAYLYNARDGLIENTFFASLPFADLLARHVETRSLLDVLRSLEDKVEKPELDRQFFEDLREWFRIFEKVVFTDSAESAEIIILLINKLIFAKTLEDHGLVPYRWIQDEYERQKERWEPKGAARVIRAFFQSFESFFDEYYDTELFERKVWNHLVLDEANLERFSRNLEKVLGISRWDDVFKRGIVHYNYRRINEDIFGKSYEMFLAANRKDEGIFYTPAPITTPMADSLVTALFSPLVERICALVHQDRCDFAAADELMDELANLRIADTAGGSGGYLIKVLRAIWAQYGKIEAALAWMDAIKIKEGGDLLSLPVGLRAATGFRRQHAFDTKRILVARILLRHIHAIDKDAGALEVAKTNVWKEAVKLTPRDYNFRELKGDVQKILPNLELNFLRADSLVDIGLEKQVAYLGDVSQHAIRQLWELRDNYIENPSDHAPLERALALRARLRENLTEQFQQEPLPEPPAFLALMFFPCWFERDGSPKANPGFDGIIGNPPWEAVKPVRKEFAQRFFKDATHLGKYGMDSVDFDKWMAAKLKDDSAFRDAWAKYQDDYASYKKYLAAHFRHQGEGDINYFKLFIENNLNLLRQHGHLSVLVPSGIQTDEGCGDMRKWLVTEHKLEEITSFENKGYDADTENGIERRKVFPDVHPQYKFGFIKVTKGVTPSDTHTFDGRFYLHDPKDVFGKPVKYSIEMMRRFSPQNYSIMEFRTERDYELCSTIRSNHQLLGDFEQRFRRELHMTEDAHFFRKRAGHKLGKGELPLYEGKMIYQFNTDYAPGTYYVLESEVRVDLLRKEIFRIAKFVRDSDSELLEGKPIPKKKGELEAMLQGIFTTKNFKLHYECERLAYRKIGRSTDERTLIAACIKPQMILGESLNYLTPVEYHLGGQGTLTQKPTPSELSGSLVCLFNSLTLNYYMRNKISANVNLFYLYELPIPPLDAKQKKQLAAAAVKLSKKPDDLKERAKLEVLIARDLYGLSPDDWRHLCGSFIYGGASDSKADLDEIIRLASAAWPP